MINVPLLRKELEFITQNPQNWEQGAWLKYKHGCGTTGCLFGNALLHAGYVEETPERAEYTLDARFESWTIAGAELFGLTEGQASLMSSEENTLYLMWSLANIFTDGEIKIPLEVTPSQAYSL